MATGAIFITINPDSNVTLADRTRNFVTARKPQCLTDLITMLKAVQAGSSLDAVSVAYGAVDPVYATGAYTVTADIAADDVVVIAGVTLTCKASAANGTTQFNKGVSATATATNLAACINANTTVNKLVVATSALGVVTMVCTSPGTIGNLITTTETSNVAGGITVGAATLTTGAGAPTINAISL